MGGIVAGLLWVLLFVLVLCLRFCDCLLVTDFLVLLVGVLVLILVGCCLWMCVNSVVVFYVLC